MNNCLKYTTSGLRIFMQNHIFENIIKKVGPWQGIISLIKYYEKQYTMDIYIFLHYVHFVLFCSLKFPINA